MTREKTERWILREFRKQLGRRCSRSRTRAIRELALRAEQIVREYQIPEVVA